MFDSLMFGGKEMGRGRISFWLEVQTYWVEVGEVWRKMDELNFLARASLGVQGA